MVDHAQHTPTDLARALMRAGGPAARRGLASSGRGGDTRIAHLTPGEGIIPRSIMQDPAMVKALAEALYSRGMNLDDYIVGPGAERNPATGLMEFHASSGGHGGPGGDDGTGGTGTGAGTSGGNLSGRAGAVGTPGVSGGFAPGDFNADFNDATRSAAQDASRMARGEGVVVEDRLGVTMTEIIKSDKR